MSTTLVSLIVDEAHQITNLEPDDQAERELIRLMNNLGDALARNGFWVTERGTVRQA